MKKRENFELKSLYIDRYIKIINIIKHRKFYDFFF